MQYLMIPLEDHADYGFGATADAFHRAALDLEKQQDKKFFFEHLPENFLLRHSVELFLKSGIVVIHRTLKLPFAGQSANSSPMVRIEDEWTPFHRVHSVADLYGYWKGLIREHEVVLATLCEHGCDWKVPSELDSWIEAIEKTDPNSTYYRYPLNRDKDLDKKKSPFKEVAAENLFPRDLPKGKFVKALIIENQDKEFVRAYSFDDSTEKEATAALLSAAEILSNFHAMMRIELTHGW
jgi:hypothetical protein